MRLACQRHDGLVEACVYRHGGALVRPCGEGDSRFAVFVRATDALAASLGKTPPVANADDHHAANASARAALGEDAFEAAWVEGRAMSLEQVVEYALQDASVP